MSASQQKYH